MKSKRGAAKRFKVRGSGSIKRAGAYKRHILTKKTTKRKRQMRRDRGRSFQQGADPVGSALLALRGRHAKSQARSHGARATRRFSSRPRGSAAAGRMSFASPSRR